MFILENLKNPEFTSGLTFFEKLNFGIIIALIGMGFTIFVLLSLLLVIKALGKFSKEKKKELKETVNEINIAHESPVEKEEEGISPKIIAAITLAIHKELSSESFVITKIKRRSNKIEKWTNN